MKFLISLMLAVSTLLVQIGGVFAAPALQTASPLKGAVQGITLETDPITGITIVLVTVVDSNQVFQTVRVSEKTAKDLGLVSFDGDGKLVIHKRALGKSIEIKSEMVIPEHDENRHPVGNALATFFSNIPGLEYDTIMFAYNEGTGFGVIAQALWLTTKLEGNAEVFQALLLAKNTGDYTDFTLNDGTTPKNWIELRNALYEGKKLENPGSVMSDKKDGNGNHPEKNKEKDKNKEKEKGNNEEKDKEKK